MKPVWIVVLALGGLTQALAQAGQAAPASASSPIASTVSGQAGLLGTKVSSPVTITTSSTGTGVGVGALIQMLVALGIVAFLLKVLLPRFAGKLNGKFQTKSGSGIKLEESVQVPGGAIHIVTARGRTFLVGTTPQSIQHLAELTPVAPEIDPFEATLLGAAPFDPNSVDLQNQNQAYAGVMETVSPQVASGDETLEREGELDPVAALDRLSHITGGHVLQ